MSDVPFNVESILGYNTGLALVKVQMGDTVVTMPSEKAREIANMITACAEASEMDRAVFRFFTEEASMSVERAGNVIRDLRKFREGAT